MTLLALIVIAMPALASLQKYTSTDFRYIGDVLHSREVQFQSGRVTYSATGEGMAKGYHDVKTSAGSAVYTVYGTAWQEKMHHRTDISGLTATDASADKKMRLINIVGATGASINTGVEMDRGESGFIKQGFYTSAGHEGAYVESQSHFGNTGGRTRRDFHIDGFISDRLDVQGYSEVWERTTLTDGSGVKTGWWDSMP